LQNPFLSLPLHWHAYHPSLYSTWLHTVLEDTDTQKTGRNIDNAKEDQWPKKDTKTIVGPQHQSISVNLDMQTTAVTIVASNRKVFGGDKELVF
jgi:hypothetical protein